MKISKLIRNGLLITGLAGASWSLAGAQTASLLPNAEQTFVDLNGQPLAAGRVYFYIPTTTTPKATWRDAAGAVTNANPVVLDAAGRAIIYGAGTYRQVVKDVFGNTVWDQLTSGPGGSGAMATVSNIAALVALGTSSAQYGLVYVQNYVGTAGIGGGVFAWDAANVSAGNSCTIFAASGVVTGRWVRQNQGGAFPVESCGVLADGTTDNATAMQAAMNLAIPLTVGAPNIGLIKVNSGLTFDVTKTSLDCQGAILNFRGLTNGTALTLTTSSNDPNAMGGYNTIHPIQNCFLQGADPSAGVTNGVVFTPTTISGSPWITGIVFSNIGAYGFDNLFTLSSGTVATTLRNIWYAGTSAANIGTFMNVVGASNAGENYYVDHAYIANGNACFVDQNGSANNVTINAVATSCDGTNYILTGGAVPGSLASNMTVFFDGHIEATQNTDYTINTANGGFNFVHGSWVGTVQPTHTVCNTGVAGSAMGVRIGQVQFNAAASNAFQPFDRFFCDGTGNFVVSGASTLGNTQIGFFAAANNLVPSASNLILGSFVTAGTVTLDAVVKPTGTSNSLKLVNSAGAASASLVVPCSPGKIAGMQSYVQTSGLVADGATWTESFAYTDDVGNVLMSNTRSGTAELASFSRQSTTPPQLLSPPGTTKCLVQFKLDAGGGTATVYYGYPMFVLQ